MKSVWGATSELIKSRRGAVHSLEAFLSALIVFSALMYSSSFPSNRDQNDLPTLDSTGIQVLLKLDAGQTLGDLVENRDWDALERCLRATLPSSLSFNVTIFDEDGERVNDRPISNGGLIGRDIYSIEYPLVVESGSCLLYRIRLQLGR